MVGLLAFVGIAATVRTASAFCRTSACSTCELDPDTGCRTGTPIQWPQFCVSYSMQYQASATVDLATATDAAEKAFGVWQNVRCPGSRERPSIYLGSMFGSVACKVHEYNQVDGNANIIMFHDDVWPYAEGEGVLALTTVTFSKKTGDIYDVDMEVNAQQRLSTGEPVDPFAYDLQSIMTHEAGHFIGLAHSFDPAATMWPQYAPGTDTFRDLSDDDVAAVCAVYPPQPLGACDFVPRQGFSPECGLYPQARGSCSLTRASGSGIARDGALSMAWLAAFALSLCRRRVRPESRETSARRAMGRAQ